MHSYIRVRSRWAEGIKDVPKPIEPGNAPGWEGTRAAYDTGMLGMRQTVDTKAIIVTA